MLERDGDEFSSWLSSSGVWERRIRTTRSILNTILNEYKGRIDTSSLHTFLYEVMAIPQETFCEEQAKDSRHNSS